VPEISRFYGIYIYYNNHNPPHFHAIYGEYEALIEIENLSILAGKLPTRALGLVINGLQYLKKNSREYGHKQRIIKNLTK